MQALTGRALAESLMIYRKLGSTGLNVSIIGFGNWVTGHDQKAQET